jgi:hypothetical protein
MTAEPLVLSVAIESEAPADQASALTNVFAHYGIDADVKTVMERRSAEPMPWAIEISVAGSIAAFFFTFGSTFGRTAARDPYPVVTEWIKALWTARADSGTGQGSIEISDSHGTTLVLAKGIPDKALDALASVPWDRVQAQHLTWDDTTSDWRDQSRVNRAAAARA